MGIITAAHGGGGKETARLIKEVFAEAFGNGADEDSAVLDIKGKTAFTTDSFVVKPLFFKGGDIGRLAVCGTVNDLLTCGAVPKYLSAGFILEEGASIEEVAAVARSMRSAADEAGCAIVTGDTKVIEGGGGVYINTAGIGEIVGEPLTFKNAVPGDKIIVTGTLGDHHACIMSARMGIDNDIESDAAPLVDIVHALKGFDVRGLRDITRGGLATCLNEASELCGLGAAVYESALRVSAGVAGLCAILGLDPLYMANEGKMLVCIAADESEKALAAVRGARYGGGACIVGEFTEKGRVVLETSIGGRRVLPRLTGESLPRIC